MLEIDDVKQGIRDVESDVSSLKFDLELCNGRIDDLQTELRDWIRMTQETTGKLLEKISNLAIRVRRTEVADCVAKDKI
jgi:pheromone shutdown protein TraB